MASSSCAPSCGQWTDPSSRAKFDLFALCGNLLTYEDFTINVCGRVACNQNFFCAVPKDSVCGVDPEALHYGMVVRNSTEPCGTSATCARCDVLARVTDRTLTYSAIVSEEDPSNTVRGISFKLPSVGQTSVQRDGTDSVGGACNSAVVLNFLCDCPSPNATVATSVTNLKVTKNLEECTYAFDILTPEACYEGFCEGVPPVSNENRAKDGGLIALGLILAVLLCLGLVRTRVGIQRLLGMTQKFSRARSRVSGQYTGISESGQDDGIGMGARGGDDGL